MEKDKLFSESAEADKEKDVVMEEEAEEKEMSDEEFAEEEKEEEPNAEEKEDEKEMAEEEVAKECAEEEEDKDMSCENSDEKEMAEEDKEMSCDNSDDKEMAEEKECSEKEEFSEEEKECSEKEEEDSEEAEEKSMSEQAKEFAETEEDKEFIDKFFAYELKDMVTEILSLKKFQDAQIKQETEMKLNAILANVKGDIAEKKFAEFVEEGAKLTLSELDAFENKVKAFAYDEYAKTKNFSSEEEPILSFANTDTNRTKAEMSADDIYKKYL